MAVLQKHARELLRRMESLGLACEITPSQRHYSIVASKGSVSVRTSLACSPSDEDTCIKEVLRRLRAKFAERGVHLNLLRQPTNQEN